MYSLFENLMIFFFFLGDFIWLGRIWKDAQVFSAADQAQAITITIGFLLGFFYLGVQGRILGAVICLMGYIVSQFTVAAVFYEKYKDMEIPHE